MFQNTSPRSVSDTLYACGTAELACTSVRCTALTPAIVIFAVVLHLFIFFFFHPYPFFPSVRVPCVGQDAATSRRSFAARIPVNNIRAPSRPRVTPRRSPDLLLSACRRPVGHCVFNARARGKMCKGLRRRRRRTVSRW